MRRALAALEKPDHAGLAHDVYMPPKIDDTESERKKIQQCLNHLTDLEVPKGYEQAFERWKGMLQQDSRTGFFCVRARSRVLLGQGYPSATEVGILLHRTWGMPVIPGSSLKGLVANYVQAVYGPEEGESAPEREHYRGVGWKANRSVQAPGSFYRRIFGSPKVDGKDAEAHRGGVIFHDAMWVPQGGRRPFGRDVITVHQKKYYEGKAKPNDYESPTPISFLTVRPGSVFLVAWTVLDGDEALSDRVRKYLQAALREWGVGAKTAAGYGRLWRDEGGETSTLLDRLRG